jgi:hypothetical protein
MNKKCTTCKEIKPLKFFPVKSQNKDGYSYACKECVNKYKRKWNNKNKDKVSENNSRYSKTHKIQRAANNKARMVKLFKNDSCYFCGSSFFLHKHHEDYNRPFDVIVLCESCHKKIHNIKKVFHKGGNYA